MADHAITEVFLDDGRELLVCPQCDALYRSRVVGKGDQATCTRCHTVLAAPRRKAGMLIICLALATVILIFAAVFFPFLTLEAQGFRSSSSLLDIALSFSHAGLRALVFLMLALVLAIPAVRASLLIYVLTPLAFDRTPSAFAAPAFRLAQNMKPWAMAEVFALGCAVALVKITELAQVSLGQAFWMFAVLVGLVVIQDRFLCSWSVWNALTKPNRS
ncbi:MAG: paraquat-inducible protein A [Pseudomonadota bacterium]